MSDEIKILSLHEWSWIMEAAGRVRECEFKAVIVVNGSVVHERPFCSWAEMNAVYSEFPGAKFVGTVDLTEKGLSLSPVIRDLRAVDRQLWDALNAWRPFTDQE